MILKKNVVTILLLLTFPVATFGGDKPFTGLVTKVVDGDSLVISTGRKKVEVRLYGVDCPEYNQSYSKAAKSFVKKNVYQRKVTVKPEYYDRYGRLVAIVARGDWSLNGELVRSGLTWVYPQYCRKSICKSWQKEQKLAQKEKSGLWAEKDPFPPWKWKRMKQK